MARAKRSAHREQFLEGPKPVSLSWPCLEGLAQGEDKIWSIWRRGLEVGHTSARHSSKYETRLLQLSYVGPQSRAASGDEEEKATCSDSHHFLGGI